MSSGHRIVERPEFAVYRATRYRAEIHSFPLMSINARAACQAIGFRPPGFGRRRQREYAAEKAPRCQPLLWRLRGLQPFEGSIEHLQGLHRPALAENRSVGVAADPASSSYDLGVINAGVKPMAKASACGLWVLLRHSVCGIGPKPVVPGGCSKGPRCNRGKRFGRRPLPLGA